MKKNNYENGDLAKPNTFDIGTGMYKITSISSEKIVLEKNSNYREKDKNPKIEKINILLFSNLLRIRLITSLAEPKLLAI